MSRGLQVTAHYTWSRTRDQTDHSNNNDGRATQDPYNPMADYGPAYWDVPHRFVASYVYELPFFKESQQPILKYVVAGWQVSGITTIESGRPFDVRIGQDVANTGHMPQRPDMVGTPTENCGRGARQLHFSRRIQDAGAVHVRQHAAQHPARTRTDHHGSGARQELLRSPAGPSSSSASKCFNLFNRANFNNPNATFGTANFGRITSAQNMRQMQLGAKSPLLIGLETAACVQFSP